MGERDRQRLTDAEGRWRSEALPATGGPDGRLDVRFTHPDYFAVESRIDGRRRPASGRASRS